jgi:hypothetical protein
MKLTTWITASMAIAAMAVATITVNAYAEEEAFKLSTISVADKLLYLQEEDLNLDGLKDILIVHRKGLQPDETKWVSIFWQMADGGFSTAADQSWEIDSLAVSLDIGNVAGDGRMELCILTPSGVSYYPIDGDVYETSPRVLFETDDLLGLFPSKRTVPLIDFVRDWNGDGRDEVAVFKFHGLSIFYPDATGDYSIENLLEMELQTSIGRVRSEGEREQTDGLWMSYSFPAMKLLDFDGDGLDDLCATRNGLVRVYRRTADGYFDAKPVIDHFFDVLTQKEKIEGIANVETIVYDLNNDGLGDAIVTKQTAKGPSNFRGVINIFNGSQDGYAEQPDQVIISEGTASALALIRDVNGDDRLDLILPSVKISISAIIRFLVTRSIPISFNIFLLHEDSRFSERPDFTKEVKFKIDFSGDSDTQAMDLDGDYNGDKRKDFVFGTGENELSIYLGESGHDDRLFSKKPVAQVEAEAYGDLRSPDLNGDGYSDMLIYYPNSNDKKGMVQVLMNLRKL